MTKNEDNDEDQLGKKLAAAKPSRRQWWCSKKSGTQKRSAAGTLPVQTMKIRTKGTEKL